LLAREDFESDTLSFWNAEGGEDPEEHKECIDLVIIKVSIRSPEQIGHIDQGGRHTSRTCGSHGLAFVLVAPRTRSGAIAALIMGSQLCLAMQSHTSYLGDDGPNFS
jgi:hypothetical protein